MKENHLQRNRGEIFRNCINNILQEMEVLKSMGDYFGCAQHICFVYSLRQTIQYKGTPLLTQALDQSNFSSTLDQICGTADDALLYGNIETRLRLPYFQKPLEQMGISGLRASLRC